MSDLPCVYELSLSFTVLEFTITADSPPIGLKTLLLTAWQVAAAAGPQGPRSTVPKCLLDNGGHKYRQR